MAHWLVRKKIYFSILVEADNEDEAMDLAEDTPEGDWDENGSNLEAELYTEDTSNEY